MDSVSRAWARFAARLRYEEISPAAVHEAKRFLLDSLGCAAGGFASRDCALARRYVREAGGTPQATVLGTRERTSLARAAFVNSLEIRVLDFNDIYWKQDPSHPSDLIPAALGPAEMRGLGGRDLIAGIVLAYEIEMRLCEAGEPGIRERGWHHATLTGFAAPAVAGRMLGLSEDQIVNAIGISACHSFTAGSVTAGKLTMMKNTVDPMATAAGVEAAVLASLGYEGPEPVVEGREGLVHCLGPEWNLGVLTEGLGESFRITQCSMKGFPTEALTHAPLTALLRLRAEHSIHPGQVARVRIKTIRRAAEILSDPSKYHPSSKETADHSLPYCAAVALMDGRVTPASFDDAHLADAALSALIQKIEVKAEPSFEALFPKQQTCEVEIELSGGARHSLRVDYPKGDPRDPMSDAGVEEKFRFLTEGRLREEHRTRLVQFVWSLEEQRSLAPLFEAMVVE